MSPTYRYECSECERVSEIDFPAGEQPTHMACKTSGDCDGVMVRKYTPPNLTGMPTRGPQSKHENENR